VISAYDTKELANAIADQLKEMCAQLSDINFQLERIADHLEATEGES